MKYSLRSLRLTKLDQSLVIHDSHDVVLLDNTTAKMDNLDALHLKAEQEQQKQQQQEEEEPWEDDVVVEADVEVEVAEQAQAEAEVEEQGFSLVRSLLRHSETLAKISLFNCASLTSKTIQIMSSSGGIHDQL
ncbi:hypothetical protein EC957_004483 [Mortierella hygrophila]|uniref:Uncharacterized protein n=1 Tax=Mortierella hygrophila TaxID=979708 RepID=A0A9P6FER9_9FUNG|nr:hypothetical protein EC957_004483 [Mortierella hygrophila]